MQGEETKVEQLLRGLRYCHSEGADLYQTSFRNAVNAVIHQGFSTVEKLAKRFNVPISTVESWRTTFANFWEYKSILSGLIEEVRTNKN